MKKLKFKQTPVNYVNLDNSNSASTKNYNGDKSNVPKHRYLASYLNWKEKFKNFLESNQYKTFSCIITIIVLIIDDIKRIALDADYNYFLYRINFAFYC